MKLAIAATLGLLCMTSQAQTLQSPLDLDLPSKVNIAEPNSAAGTADDPPGMYYGDVDGKDDSANTTTMSGSVTTTAGYAKGYGSGFSTAADLNMSTQLKNGKTIEMNISVMRSDGLPTRWGRGYWSGLDAGPGN